MTIDGRRGGARLCVASALARVWLGWVPPDERDLPPYDLYTLYTADEAFLCSTAGGIFPVVAVGGRQVGCGRLGSITQRVHERY